MSSPGKRGDLWLAEKGRESQNLLELIRSSESKRMTLSLHRRCAVRTLGLALTSGDPVCNFLFRPNEGLLLRDVVTSLDLRSQSPQIKQIRSGRWSLLLPSSDSSWGFKHWKSHNFQAALKTIFMWRMMHVFPKEDISCIEDELQRLILTLPQQKQQQQNSCFPRTVTYLHTRTRSDVISVWLVGRDIRKSDKVFILHVKTASSWAVNFSQKSFHLWEVPGFSLMWWSLNQ